MPEETTIYTCENCDKSNEERGDFKIFNNKCVCNECYREVYTRCISCDKIISKKLSKKAKLLNTDGTLAREIYVCKDCKPNLVFKCKHCEELFYRDSIKILDGDYFCIKCFNELYFTCTNCHRTLPKSEEIIHSRRRYCNNCFARAKYIKAYNYIPEKHNYIKKFEKDIDEYGDNISILYMGFELEVEISVEKEGEKLKKLDEFLITNNLSDKFYFKHDGTVQGFEIVSHPFTLSAKGSELKIRQLLKFLYDEGFTSFLTGNCGLHIHLSKDFFSDDEIKKMRLFFTNNQDSLRKFSKRYGCNTRYCKFEDVDNKRILKNTNSTKYLALRTQTNEKTIEIRLFRGTLSYKRFLACLQFAEAISLYVKNVGYSHLFKTSWKQFTDWCKREGTYCNFIEYIKNFKKHSVINKESLEGIMSIEREILMEKREIEYE